MTWYIKLAIFILLAGIAVTAVYRYNAAIEEAVVAKAEQERLNGELKTQKHETELAQARYETLDKVLSEKSKSENKIRQDLSLFGAKLDKLGAATPETRKWLDTPVPADVLGLLHDGPGEGVEDSVRVPAKVPD